ncbi:hypothetical protein, partial [Sphingomonas quercus]
MNRRDFGKALVAGAAGAALSGEGAAAAAAVARDLPYRVLPDLKVRALGDIHTGGDYHTLVGNGPTAEASL